ncbi:MAG: type II toxin-antitoxin system RelE/ParE family toxin [Tepidisphaeraceae bacterium]|jgi:proteic killer suppression protein
MRFRFASSKLRILYETGTGRFPPDVVRGFFRVMSIIAEAADERDLYAFNGLRYEKLKGDRVGQHSLRLNDQWRLILRPVSDVDGRVMLVVEIVDYHQ